MTKANKTFGSFFKQLRVNQRRTLREFCLEHGLDPGNLSRLERDRQPPPQSREKLEQYARALGIQEGGDDWYEFFDLAAVGAGRIPDALLSDEGVVARLPLVFRTLRQQRVDGDQLDELIELIRRS